MSQIYKQVTAGNLPPSVPTQFTGNSGTAVPSANNLNELGDDTTVYNANGISTSASGSTVTILLNNRVQGTATTVGATTADPITFAMGATPGAFRFILNIAAFRPTVPAGAGYGLDIFAVTDGVTATVVDTDLTPQEQAALSACTVTAIASANNVIVRVTGVAGSTVNWSVSGTYERAV